MREGRTNHRCDEALFDLARDEIVTRLVCGDEGPLELLLKRLLRGVGEGGDPVGDDAEKGGEVGVVVVATAAVEEVEGQLDSEEACR